MTSIRVSEANRAKLLALQGKLQSDRQKSVSMNETVGWMIDVVIKKQK